MTTIQIKSYDSDSTHCSSVPTAGTVPTAAKLTFLPRKNSLCHLDDLFAKDKERSVDAISTNISEGIHRLDERLSVVSEGYEKKTAPKETKLVSKSSGDEASSDNSGESPKFSGKFVKVRLGGAKDPQPLKPWEDDINYLFSQDRSKFIGEFHTEEYKIIRGYLQGSGTHLRLYYTKVEPFKKKLATVCIVHGLGGHSGRFMDVRESLSNIC